ncbi:MAG: CapA family protein [bacterium]
MLKKISLMFIFIVAIFLTPNTTHADEDVVLLFAGDTTFGGHYPEIADTQDAHYSFKNIWKLIEDSDAFMVNCENPITEAVLKILKQFNFKMNPNLTNIFSLNRITLVNIANNHICDYGTQGLLDTIDNLDKFGIEHIGAGKNLEEARQPVVKIIKGMKIFFLGYGNYSPAGENSPGVAYRNKKDVIEDIKNAKRNGADIIIVNFHWGVERATEPTKSDVSLAKTAIDNGADVIIGHHPHVIQPIKAYRGKPIFYSLGNFIFGGNRKGARNGLLAKITITPNKEIHYEGIKLRVDGDTKYQPYEE